MRNQIHNAVVSITKRDLVSCKRCGCPDLAWVKFKSGKSGLVETAGTRPFWRGEGPAPEGLWALKFNYHRCETYTAAKEEAVRRSSFCHPKADKPREILTDAGRVIIAEAAREGGLQRFADVNDPIFKAMEILLTAQSSVQELPKEMQ